MSELTDYIDAEIEKAVRARPMGRWIYDCPACGTPYKEHGEECVPCGKELKGIVT